jgi:hypothetical protein
MQKKTCVHPIGQPVMDRPNLQIGRFDAAEGPLHQSEGSIAAHCRRVVENHRRQAGAHYIDAVGRRLCGDLGALIAAERGDVPLPRKSE